MKEKIKESEITKFIIALENESSIKAAAESIGIGERTAHRWLNDPDCVHALAEFNRQTRTAAALIVAEARLSANKDLIQLSKSAKSESVRLKAILALLDRDFPFLAEMEMDARVRLIEDEFQKLSRKE